MSRARRLQVPRFDRPFAPVVVEAVVIRHRREHQLVDIDAVKAHHVDVVVLASAHVRHVDPFERPDAAVFAELVMRDRIPAPPVVRERVFARQQAECVRKGIDRPQAYLGADRAVALAGAGADVEIRLEADGATVTASGVGLGHRAFSKDDGQSRGQETRVRITKARAATREVENAAARAALSDCCKYCTKPTCRSDIVAALGKSRCPGVHRCFPETGTEEVKWDAWSCALTECHRRINGSKRTA